MQCLNCNFSTNIPNQYLNDYTAVGWSSSDKEVLQNKASIQSYVDFKILREKEKTKRSCPECYKSHENSPLYTTQYINELPTILIFAIAFWIDINRCLQFKVSNTSKEYILKGIIYSNGDHFTARLIDEELNVWYHDGQVTRSLCQKEQPLKQADCFVPLQTFGRYRAILAFYVER